MTKALRLPEGLDTSKPSPARIYDYMLRGTHHFDVDEDSREAHRDRSAGDQGLRLVEQGFPPARGGLDRPAGGQAVPRHRLRAADRREHARGGQARSTPTPAWSTWTTTRWSSCYSQGILDPSGSVSVLCADLRDPDSILGSRAVRELIDSARADRAADDRGADVRRRLGRPVEPGVAVRGRDAGRAAYLSLSHLTDDAKPPVAVERVPPRVRPRDRADVLPLEGGRSGGSSTGSRSSRRTRAASRRSPTAGCGAPRTCSWPTATARAGSTARWRRVP